MIALFLCGSVLAAESDFVGFEAGSGVVDEPETTLSVELGGMFGAGNTDTRSLSFQLEGAHRWDRSKVSTETGVLLGSAVLDEDSDGMLSEEERQGGRVETARRKEAWLRYDHYVNAGCSLYGLTGGYTDLHSGYNSRYNVQAGTSYTFVDGEAGLKPMLVGELGMDVAREDDVENADPQLIYAARTLLSLQYAFEEAFTVAEELEGLVNVQDPENSRVNSETSVTASISDGFALKFSYLVRYDHQPVQGFAKADQTGLITLMTSIF